LVEQLTLNQLVLGSSPSRGTNFAEEIVKESPSDTLLTQETPDSEAEPVNWPKRIKHRKKVLATIYRKTQKYPLYRVSWRANGRRMMKSFPTYGGKGGALEYAEELVKELAKGSQIPNLTAGQAGDALAAFDRLKRFYQSTGERRTLLEAVSDYCEAMQKLSGYTLGEVVERFLTTVAVVQRKLLGEAVADFIADRKPLTESKDGKRPKLSPVYAYNVAMWLNEFAGTFPGYAVCDLTKEHLNAYLGNFTELSAKSRNDRRAVVRMFLRWCVAKDYLSQHHRLFDAVKMKTEVVDQQEIDFYRPGELRSMLDAADDELRPVIFLGGLAGLRREEILRLDFADVWRVKGKIEISARIAKGRKRRLVDICPALALWLNPYRKATGPVWAKSPDALEEALRKLRDDVKVPARRNGLRHSFITFHMAMHANENLTSAEAGNSPQMIHDHYRALATRKDALKWFAVRPSKSTVKIIPMPVATGGAA
jgi:integrase